MCTGRREEASRLRGEQEKCWSSVMQYDRLTLAVFEKGLRDRNSPICIWRGKMATVTRGPRQGSTRACCPVIKTQLYMCTGRREEVSWLREEQESVGRQGCEMPQCHTVWPSATKMGTSLTVLSLSPLVPPTPGKAAVITFVKADSTLRTVRAVPHPNK
jgi:hypothetical protein